MRPDFFNFRWTVSVFIILSAILSIFTSDLAAKEQSKAKFSNDPAVNKRIAEGVRLGRDGEYDLAIAEFTAALKQEPKNVHAFNNLGVAYVKLNKPEEALSYYKKAIEQGVANATTYFLRGTVLANVKQEPAKAVPDFTKAIEMQPQFSKAYVNRASAYSSLKKFDKAVADYNKAVEIDPMILKAILEKRALAYYRKGDYAKAGADVERAKQLGVRVDKKFDEELQKAIRKKH